MLSYTTTTMDCMLTSGQKGAIAEAAIVAAAIEAGIGVARPFVDERYDLIFDTGGAAAASPVQVGFMRR